MRPIACNWVEELGAGLADRSMLSNSLTSVPTGGTAPPLLLALVALTTTGLLLAAVKEEPWMHAPVALLRNRPLLPLPRLPRSAADAFAAAAADSASQALLPLPDAPLGRGNSELPVAAVLKGDAAAAANGLLTEDELRRPLPGLLPLCPLLLLGLPVAALSMPEPDLTGTGLDTLSCATCFCVPCIQSGDAAFPPDEQSAVDGGARSIMTTVMLSLLPRSTAALVSTVAATRAAALREAPFSCSQHIDLMKTCRALMVVQR